MTTEESKLFSFVSQQNIAQFYPPPLVYRCELSFKNSTARQPHRDAYHVNIDLNY